MAEPLNGRRVEIVVRVGGKAAPGSAVSPKDGPAVAAPFRVDSHAGVASQRPALETLRAHHWQRRAQVAESPGSDGLAKVDEGHKLVEPRPHEQEKGGGVV